MIRLSVSNPEGSPAVIRIEGRLTSEALSDLESLCGALGGGASVVLDLSSLGSIDADGIECLRELRSGGCRTIGASLYISRLLNEDPQ